MCAYLHGLGDIMHKVDAGRNACASSPSHILFHLCNTFFMEERKVRHLDLLAFKTHLPHEVN